MVRMKTSRSHVSRFANALFGLLATAAATTGHAQGQRVPVATMDGLPVLTVKLGSLKADFLLDTGGAVAITVPKPLIVPSTGVVELAETMKATDAGGHVQEVHKVRVEAASIGDVQLGSLDGLVNYRWGLNVSGQDDPEVTKKGIVGLQAFDKRGVLFDLGKGSLTVMGTGEKPQLDASWASAPFAYDKRGVVVRLEANGAAAEVVLDSAATSSLLKKEAPVLTGANNVCKGKPKDAPVCGATTFRTSSIGSGKLSRMEFGVVAMGPLPFDGLLGIDFFTSHSIYLDFAARQMHFRRSK